MERIQDLVLRHEALKEERRSWEQDWKELARHFLPRKCRLEAEARTATNEGGLRGGTLDPTPYYAMRDLAAGLHGGMTSPARPWFTLALQDQDIPQTAGVKRWLGAAADRIRAVFHQSNFYNAVHQVYGELGAFGTAFFFALEDEGEGGAGVRFLPLTVGEYCLDVNEKGVVDTVFRTLQMTLRQLVLEFGEEALPEPLRELYKQPRQWNERFQVVHAVYPRPSEPKEADERAEWPGTPADRPQEASQDTDRREYGPQRRGEGAQRPHRGGGASLPFASVYWLDDWGGASAANRNGGAKHLRERVILREGGFSSFPGFGVRWDVTGGDVYGRGPAMDALPSSRKLQQITATTLKSLHKTVDPPMAAPSGMENLSLLPGAVNIVAGNGGSHQAVYPILQIRYDLQAASAAIETEREMIREGLFNNLFRMLLNSDRRQITAREVAAREEEKLILIGPVLERMHNELFIPLIDRTFSIMARAKRLPEPPEELTGTPLRVEFVSILAQAQKMVATAGIEQFAAFAGQLTAVWPEARDAFNPDGALDKYAEYLGTPAESLRGQDEREAVRGRRAEQEAAAVQQEQAAASVDAVQKLGSAGLEGSALGAILGPGMASALEGGMPQ